MERKKHWAWSAFTTGRVPADRMHIHFEQEYATYVRDFPVLLARLQTAMRLKKLKLRIKDRLNGLMPKVRRIAR